MKIPNGLWVCLRKFAWPAILLLPSIGTAQTQAEELKRCLHDLDGMEWKLPYQPYLQVSSCSSQTSGYITSHKALAGQGNLELIGDPTLASDTENLSTDEKHAAEQSAVFTHFDALFRRHGYRRIAVEQGDARTRYNPDTLGAIRGRSALSDEEVMILRKKAAEDPPIPYTNLARYVRPVLGKEISLVYKMRGNTWSIALEGLPAAPSAVGVKQ